MVLNMPPERFRQGAGVMGRFRRLPWFFAGNGGFGSLRRGRLGRRQGTQQIPRGFGLGKGLLGKGQAEMALNAGQQFHARKAPQPQVALQGDVKRHGRKRCRLGAQFNGQLPDDVKQGIGRNRGRRFGNIGLHVCFLGALIKTEGPVKTRLGDGSAARGFLRPMKC